MPAEFGIVGSDKLIDLKISDIKDLIVHVTVSIDSVWFGLYPVLNSLRNEPILFYICPPSDGFDLVLELRNDSLLKTGAQLEDDNESVSGIESIAKEYSFISVPCPEHEPSIDSGNPTGDVSPIALFDDGSAYSLAKTSAELSQNVALETDYEYVDATATAEKSTELDQPLSMVFATIPNVVEKEISGCAREVACAVVDECIALALTSVSYSQDYIRKGLMSVSKAVNRRQEFSATLTVSKDYVDKMIRKCRKNIATHVVSGLIFSVGSENCKYCINAALGKVGSALTARRTPKKKKRGDTIIDNQLGESPNSLTTQT